MHENSASEILRYVQDDRGNMVTAHAQIATSDLDLVISRCCQTQNHISSPIVLYWT